MSRVLVVHYSRTGTTRKLAEAIATATGWDLEAIVDTRDRRGFLGFLRSGFEAMTGRRTRLEAVRHDLRAYDLVVIGSPVWDRSVSTPVRTFLEEHAAELPRVAFFLTFGGEGQERALAQMAALAGRAPLATLALRQEELTREAHGPAVARFVDALRAAAASPEAPVPTDEEREAAAP